MIKIRGCIAWTFSLSVILLLFTSCAEEKPNKFRIGFSQCMAADHWRQTMLTEMKRELSFHNDVEFLYRDANQQSLKQVQQIEELFREGIDLLIVSPNEAQPLTPVIEKVYQAGIPVILVDRKTLSDQYSAFIGAENIEVGQNAGRYAVSALKGRGRVLEVSAQPNATPFAGRHKGFMEIISRYPGIEYLEKIDGTQPAAKVKAAVQSAGKIDLIFAHNDMMALDVYKICQSLGIENQTKIIGVDGLLAKNMGLDMVTNGFIDATVLYPTGGHEAIITALDILHKQPYKKQNQLFTSVIDSSNVRLMKMQGDKLAAQQTDIEQRQQVIDRQIAVSRNQSTVILIIAVTLSFTLIFGGLSFYFLVENKKITQRLERQNSEIMEQKNRLEEMSASAEQAHRAKLDFFTNISHEFRTPLSLILSPLEDLISSTKIQQGNKQTLKLIEKNVLRLYRLVNELMDFRKIEFDRMKVKATQNDLVDFTRQIVDSYKVLSQQKNISLVFTASENHIEFWFDATMIDKVIFNILSNAFKFTPEYGHIEVQLSKTKEVACIKISDSGIGMSAETLAHVFQPFVQGDFENYKGTGLGLALSRELMSLHNGTITVTSEKNKGTSFELSFPLTNGLVQEAETNGTMLADNFLTDESKLYVKEQLDVPLEADVTPSAMQSRHFTVLIIEDNQGLRDYLQNRLNQTYYTLTATDSADALEKVFDVLPDIIVCDVVIPGRNGIELTKLLKKDARTAHIPVILLTARSSEAQQLEGMKSGADAYIVKPFHYNYLLQTIETILENRSKTRDHYSAVVVPNAAATTARKTDRKFVSDFCAVVEQRFADESFSIEQICAELNISHVQLYRKVKSLLDCNVNEYIINTRLQKARFYLQHENLSISEIAFKTGFSSAAYFSTAFKAKFASTPSAFRENLKRS